MHQKAAMDDIERIQQMVATLVARSPAGVGLCLIGGFRYRFLDKSPRSSRDVDYHCPGPPEAVEEQLISLFRRRLLPEVRRALGYDGDVGSGQSPGDLPPNTRRVELAFYKRDVPHSRIEIPVDLTQVVCLDRPEPRTIEATLYLTTSDKDTVENKVVALFSRPYTKARDLLDIFLFSSCLGNDSPRRVREKLHRLAWTDDGIAGKLNALNDNRAVYVKAVAEMLSTQVEQATAANMQAAGGAEALVDRVFDILQSDLHLGEATGG